MDQTAFREITDLAEKVHKAQSEYLEQTETLRKLVDRTLGRELLYCAEKIWQRVLQDKRQPTRAEKRLWDDPEITTYFEVGCY